MALKSDEWMDRIAAGGLLTDAELGEVAISPDLLTVGMLADAARRAQRGRGVTFVRVATVDPSDVVDSQMFHEAGEIRISGAYPGLEPACGLVSAWRRTAGAIALSAWSLADIEAADEGRLEMVLGTLRAAGLDMVAEAPLDHLRSAESAVAAVAEAGLLLMRLTVDKAAGEDRSALALRARALCAAGAVTLFQPLPLVLNPFRPTTGYEDIRSVALARLAMPAATSIQVDWPRYGPKLAQVALTFGADDIYGAPFGQGAGDGPRRAPLVELRRNIEAAGFEAVERNGRLQTLASGAAHT
jgi:hypothetical protein